jgi:hypothetical protein
MPLILCVANMLRLHEGTQWHHQLRRQSTKSIWIEILFIKTVEDEKT